MIRSFLPDTIRGQILFSFLLLFVLLVVPFTWILVEYEHAAAVEERERAFLSQSVQAAILIGDTGDRTSLQGTLQSLADVSSFSWAIRDEDGTIVASAIPTGYPAPVGFVPAVDENQPQVTLVERNGLAYVAVPIPNSGNLTLLAVTSSESLEGSAWPFLRPALVGLALLIPTYSLIGWWLARRISRPLVALGDQSQAVATGLRAGVDMPDGSRDIRDLASSVNALAGQVTELTAERADMVRRLELIFEHLKEGIIVVDEEEMVVAENPYAREILGNEGMVGAGMPMAMVVRDHDLLGQLRSVREKMEPSTIPIDYARSGRSIEATAIPMQGSRAYSVVVLRDVTEIRRLESVRREFVANVSHELRTPLASIRALADTLESGAIDDREIAVDFLGKIVAEVDRLTAIVEELLDLARLQSGRVNLEWRPVRADEVILAGLDRMRPQIERAGLTLSPNLESPLPVINIDQFRIEQVLINLLHNAVKFTPPGGEIEVTARADEGGLRVDVRDTGAGIPEEELSRVFERFYKADRSRRSEGTGLGLAISKHIVRAHHGELWATSVVGQGSTFSFWIPASSAGQPTELPDTTVIASQSGD